MGYNNNPTRNWNKDGSTPATGIPALASYFYAEFKRIYDNFVALFNNAGNAFKGTGITTIDGSILRCKIIEIGDWNMDAAASANVNHGLPDHNKIRSIDVMIRGDSGNISRPLYYFSNMADPNLMAGGINYITAAIISLYRREGGGFDSASFDSTSFNRGWVTIWYTD